MPDDDNRNKDTALALPSWFEELEPDVASKLEVLDADDLWQIQATIEWYEGGPPAHIAVAELDRVVPGCGREIVDEALERSRQERKITDRDSKTKVSQSWWSLGIAATLSLGTLGCVAYLAISKSVDPALTPLLIVFMILGVGGPLAAAAMAGKRAQTDATD